jgi:hypothetical protein
VPKGPVLTVVITSATEGLDKGLKEAEKKLGIFGGSGKKLAGLAKIAAPVAGIAAATAKLGKAAADADLSVASFDTAMQNLGVSAASTDPAIKKAIAASKDLAFSSGATRDAILTLTTATGSSQKAIELLSTAQDIARLSGSDLETVTNAMAKAIKGQDRALLALVPGLEKGKDGFDTIANAEKLAAGQADLYADSASGMADKTKSSLKALAISVGQVVQPAFEGMLAVLKPIIDALGVLVNSLLPILIPLVKAVAKAFELAAKAISKVLTLIAKLIDKVRELLGPLGDAVDKIKDLNPFKGIGKNSIPTAQAAAIATHGVTQNNAGAVTINIYGDPATIEARVIRALRGYQFRNGAGSVFNPGRT